MPFTAPAPASAAQTSAAAAVTTSGPATSALATSYTQPNTPGLSSKARYGDVSTSQGKSGSPTTKSFNISERTKTRYSVMNVRKRSSHFSALRRAGFSSSGACIRGTHNTQRAPIMFHVDPPSNSSYRIRTPRSVKSLMLSKANSREKSHKTKPYVFLSSSSSFCVCY